MSKIFAPNKQLKMTNVAVVRMSKGGSRFEVACYKNKVQEYRQGSETNLDEVMHITKVFHNVSKGLIASAADLEKCFGTNVEIDVCKIILIKGQLQVSEKERKSNNEASFKEISTNITNMCINTETEKPFTITMIESALKKVNFTVHPKKSTKQQSLDAIKSLQKTIPIRRAEMKVKICLPGKDAKRLKEKYVVPMMSIQEESYHATAVIIGTVEPGRYRALADQLSQQTKGRAKVEVMSLIQEEETETPNVDSLQISDE